MTFARYKGGGGEGAFSKGQTYIVQPAGADAVNINDVSVWDDNLDVVTFNTDTDSRFEFCEQAYGVFLQDCLEYEAGYVVVVNDVSNDLTMYGIQTSEGLRMLQAHLIELVDWRILKPGVELLNYDTHEWEAVKQVDESMWVKMMEDEFFEPLINFKFAVSDGEIDRIRTARCVNADGDESLVKGDVYRVRSEVGGTISVEVEDKTETFDLDRFEFV